ncbi:TPA: trp operon leader peptide [Enterobacter ludwigii]
MTAHFTLHGWWHTS